MDKNAKYLIIVHSLVLFIILFFIKDFIGVMAWLSYVFYMFALYYSSVLKWQTYLFNIISFLSYIVVTLSFFYLGEMFSAIGAIIINTILAISWKKNQLNKEEINQVKINKISKKEQVIAFLSLALIYVSFFIIFKKLKSNEVHLNAMEISSVILFYYFSFRRNKICFLYEFLNLIIFMILWVKTMIVSPSEIVALNLIGGVFTALWIMYSLYNWKKVEIEQKNYLAIKKELK